jgi:hypothetical protein
MKNKNYIHFITFTFLAEFFLLNFLLFIFFSVLRHFASFIALPAGIKFKNTYFHKPTYLDFNVGILAISHEILLAKAKANG